MSRRKPGQIADPFQSSFLAPFVEAVCAGIHCDLIRARAEGLKGKGKKTERSHAEGYDRAKCGHRNASPPGYHRKKVNFTTLAWAPCCKRMKYTPDARSPGRAREAS